MVYSRKQSSGKSSRATSSGRRSSSGRDSSNTRNSSSMQNSSSAYNTSGRDSSDDRADKSAQTQKRKSVQSVNTAQTGAKPEKYRRKALRGRGPTPKAEDRVYHQAYKKKMARERSLASDPRLAAQRRALKHIGPHDEVVIGRNPVLEALRANIPAEELYIASFLQQDDRTQEILEIATSRGIRILEADRLELDHIARGGRLSTGKSDGVHQGVVLKIQPFEYADLDTILDDAFKKSVHKSPLFVALDGITDPHNLGAVIRSSAAFGVTGIIIPERRSASMTASAWKVSAGTAAHMPIIRVPNLNRALEKLRNAGFYSVGLDGEATATIGHTGFEKDPLVLILGSEGSGISKLTRENCDILASIPMSANVESLNASVAAGIALYATTVDHS